MRDLFQFKTQLKKIKKDIINLLDDTDDIFYDRFKYSDLIKDFIDTRHVVYDTIKSMIQ
jgi:hypothetical protein